MRPDADEVDLILPLRRRVAEVVAALRDGVPADEAVARACGEHEPLAVSDSEE